MKQVGRGKELYFFFCGRIIRCEYNIYVNATSIRPMTNVIFTVVKFNSEGIHSISRCCVTKNFHLKFKVFVKHRNQKFPSELGLGVASISNVTDLANLSSVRCISVINKGIKIGDLKVITELGYDFIHFGKEFVGEYTKKKDIILFDRLCILSSIR